MFLSVDDDFYVTSARKMTDEEKKVYDADLARAAEDINVKFEKELTDIVEDLYEKIKDKSHYISAKLKITDCAYIRHEILARLWAKNMKNVLGVELVLKGVNQENIKKEIKELEENIEFDFNFLYEQHRRHIDNVMHYSYKDLNNE